jgi:hypothetical protein
MIRPLSIALWIFFATFAWIALVAAALRGIVWHDRNRAISVLRSVPDWLAFDIIFYGLFGVGSLAVMALVAFFALRGKLPGTRKRSPRDKVPSGFPVIPSPMPDEKK